MRLSNSVLRHAPLALALALIVTGCNIFGGKGTAQLLRERDSLQRVATERDSQLVRMSAYFDTLNTALDSIKTQEQILTLPYDSDGRRLTAGQMKENLELLQAIYDRQRERIERLESRLSSSRDSVGQYRTLINYLYAQLDEKDQEIRQMQQQIKEQNSIISKHVAQARIYEKNIGELEAANKDIMDRVSEQEEIISAQAETLNTGYYVMAPLKTLQQFGIVSKGLGKKNVKYSDLRNEVFTKINILTETHFNFRANTSPKILTPVPAGSYTLTKNSDGTTTLDITDPTSFWSISSYLVIQL